MEEKRKNNIAVEAFLTAVGIFAMFMIVSGVFMWLDKPFFYYWLPVAMAIASASLASYIASEKPHELNKWFTIWLSCCFFILALAWLFVGWFQANIWTIVFLYLAVIGIATGITFYAGKEEKSEKGKQKLKDFILVPIQIIAFFVFLITTIVRFHEDHRQNIAGIIMLCSMLVLMIPTFFTLWRNKKKKTAEKINE